MANALTPTAGVRILLELQSATDGGARYHGTAFTPTVEHRYDLAIHADGQLDLTGAAEHVDLVRALARTLIKDALAQTPPVWPRRLLRWRDR